MRQREHRQNWLWWLPSCDKWFWGPVGSITCIFKDAYFRNNSSVFLSCSSSDLQGRPTSLRSTLCSLADRYCSQYLLFTIMWKLNKLYSFCQLLFAVSNYTNMLPFKRRGPCLHGADNFFFFFFLDMQTCWDRGLSESQLMGLAKQSWSFPNLTSWSHCGNQRNQHL